MRINILFTLVIKLVMNYIFFQFDFDFVKIYRVKEFRFRAIYNEDLDYKDTEKTKDSYSLKGGNTNPTLSMWNCDGEILETPQISVK